MSRWVYHSEAAFQADHALTSYLGKPEESHGHQWRVAITVGVDGLNAESYGLDFHAVHAALGDLVAPLEGTDLNAHPTIGTPSPTAENVALFIADGLRGPLAELGGTLLTVSVWEGPGNRVDLVVTR